MGHVGADKPPQGHPGGVSVKPQRTLAGVCQHQHAPSWWLKGGDGNDGAKVWSTVGESSGGDVPAEVMVLEVVAVRGCEWYGESYRSGEGEHF
nr:hypothetical protein [Tanacetum cinerariifolium]